MLFQNRILLLIALIQLVHGMAATILGPCATSLMETFSVGPGVVGLVFGAGSIGYLSGVKTGGWIAERFGVIRAFGIGMLGAGLGLLLFSASPSIELCAASFFLAGAAGGIIEPASVAAIQTMFGERARGMLSLSQVGFGIGAIAGPFLAKTVFALGHSWRLTFLIAGLAPLIVLATFPRQKISPLGARENNAPTPEPYLRNPVLWLMSLTLLFYVGGEMGLSSWSSAFFEKTRGLSKESASMAPLCIWVGVTIGRAAFWFISDRLHHLKNPHYLSSRVVLIVGALTSVGFTAGSALCPSAAVSYAMLIGAGLGMAPIWPTLMSHAAQRLGTDSPRVLSWVILGGSFGALIGQAALGEIAERLSWQTGIWVIAALLSGVALCALADRWLESREKSQNT